MVSFALASRVVGGVISSMSITRLFNNKLNKNILVSGNVLLIVTFMGALLYYKDYYLIFITFLFEYITSATYTVITSQASKLMADKYLVNFNLLSSNLASIAAVVGALAAGTIIAFLGYRIAFGLCTVSFIVCLFCIILIREHSSLSIVSEQYKKPHILHNILNLLNNLRSNKIMMYMLLITALDCLASAAHNIGFSIFQRLLQYFI